MDLNESLIKEIGKRIEWYKNLKPEEKLLGDRGLAGSIAQDDLTKLYFLVQVLTTERDRITSEKAELESKLCGMRELYELHQSNRPDLPFAVRAKIVFRMEEIFQQALSSTPECKHKEELMRRIGEETALECDGAKAVGKQLASLQAELQEAKKWRFDDTTVASLREELKAVREENEQLQATDKETKK